jgi:hypothetical protein
MISLGICFVALGVVVITLESAGVAAVCFSLAFLLIRYA